MSYKYSYICSTYNGNSKINVNTGKAQNQLKLHLGPGGDTIHSWVVREPPTRLYCCCCCLREENPSENGACLLACFGSLLGKISYIASHLSNIVNISLFQSMYQKISTDSIYTPFRFEVLCFAGVHIIITIYYMSYICNSCEVLATFLISSAFLINDNRPCIVNFFFDADSLSPNT